MSELAGRSCPLRYRYGAEALARLPAGAAETLYVVGGLYGNLPALETIEAMAAAEPGPVSIVFNGDFNWFNVDDAGFAEINRRVLAHQATLGNVEAELGAAGDAAGCGCAYPDHVAGTVVERSNLHPRPAQGNGSPAPGAARTACRLADAGPLRGRRLPHRHRARRCRFPRRLAFRRRGAG